MALLERREITLFKDSREYVFCSLKMASDLINAQPLYLDFRRPPFPANPFSNQGEKENIGTGFLKASRSLIE